MTRVFMIRTLFKGHYHDLLWPLDLYNSKRRPAQGASACLIIHNTAAASYPFQVVQSSNGGVKLHLDTRDNPSYQLTFQAGSPNRRR